MSEELRRMFADIDSLPEHKRNELIIYLRANEAYLSEQNLSNARKLGQTNSIINIPNWVTQVFCEIAKPLSPKVICDPWAGWGILAESLRAACQPEQTFALTSDQANLQIGRILNPALGWNLVEQQLKSDISIQSYDLCASILPMGGRTPHPLQITNTSGVPIELKDDLGHLLLVESALRLTPSGVGLFVVTSSFFYSQRSVWNRFHEIGLGVEAAFHLPPGTFAPYTYISTYLIVVRRKPLKRIFVASLSPNTKTTTQVLTNYAKRVNSSSLDFGRYVPANEFKGIDALRASDAIIAAEKKFGFKSTNLFELGAIKLGIHFKTRTRNSNFPNTDNSHNEIEFTFDSLENAIYIPLIGDGDVVVSLTELISKHHNYAQVVIDPLRSDARFVARFLNSEFGKEQREQLKTGITKTINRHMLSQLRIFVPDIQTQQLILEIETHITTEQNKVMALQNEINELRRELWTNIKAPHQVQKNVAKLSTRLTGKIEQHTSNTFDQWAETLPFPLASILRTWQATSDDKHQAKYEHLLHFFEATAEFISIILLSAFDSNKEVFNLYRAKLIEILKKQNLSYEKATFGTWKLTIEYLGKQTRLLLDGTSKDVNNSKEMCAELFADPSLSLPIALSKTQLTDIFSITNKYRNDWSGHGGIVGPAVAAERHQKLITELQKLREVFADTWSGIQLIQSIQCRPKQGVFENEVIVLVGSNTVFLKEKRKLKIWLDVEQLYISQNDSGKALKLLPLIQFGQDNQTFNNACYFFNRLENGGARFVSYHFVDTPELTGQFTETAEAIEFLTVI